MLSNSRAAVLVVLVSLPGKAHAQASPQALAQAAKKLPQVVQRDLGEMMKMCKEGRRQARQITRPAERRRPDR